MLRTHLGQVEDGLADPQGFIHRHRNQTGISTPEPTKSPVATDKSLATESPVVAPQESCTPVLDGTGLQNGNMGTPEPQNGAGTGSSSQSGGDNQPDVPAEPQQNGTENGSGQQNGGRP